jgi:hypothetical protein
MIPSFWAHNSSILRHRNFFNRNSNSNLDRRDEPVHHRSLRYSGVDFLRPRSPPPLVMRDKYYLEGNMDSPSAMDARTSEDKTAETPASRSKTHHHNGVIYETTAEGDVAVVQPSFDDHDGRSPCGDVVTGRVDGETRSPPTMDHLPPPHPHHRSGHRRNLSEHFQDATTLSTDPTVVTSVAVGQKHRLGYTGGYSNPAQAHRRIDSIGNSAMIKRVGPKDHRRIDSSGLDALTAAADFSREELAAAAAGGRNTMWDPSGIRRSPIEINAYDQGQHCPPPQASLSHHRHYPPGGPPTGAYFVSGASYGQPSYPPTFYSHHPGQGFGRLHPAPSSGYPVQHARGQDAYLKDEAPVQQPVLERSRAEGGVQQSLAIVNCVDHSVRLKEDLEAPRPSSSEGMDPPAPPSWRGGSHQGVQTYLTAIGVGNTTHTLEANPQLVPTAGPSPDESGARRHHRKLSSFSALAPLLFGDSSGEHPLKRDGAHHRSTSSTVSFLDVLDMQNTDAAFLRNLQAATGAPPAALNPKEALTADLAISGTCPSTTDKADPSTKLALGGTSKRIRRKCTVGGCRNRVVQGGLCIAHGAKRKQCKHPGCNKHVKKAGLCSTHGPARKRCDAVGCSKVAVQGGKCIAHGAKKRTCSVEECTKQAILGGMCKKHHDQAQQGSSAPVARAITSRSDVCQVIDTKNDSHTSAGSTGSKKPSHHRGLSIFQEISADTVGNLLSPDPSSAGTVSAAHPPSHAHRSTFSREFGNLY